MDGIRGKVLGPDPAWGLKVEFADARSQQHRGGGGGGASGGDYRRGDYGRDRGGRRDRDWDRDRDRDYERERYDSDGSGWSDSGSYRASSVGMYETGAAAAPSYGYEGDGAYQQRSPSPASKRLRASFDAGYLPGTAPPLAGPATPAVPPPVGSGFPGAAYSAGTTPLVSPQVAMGVPAAAPAPTAAVAATAPAPALAPVPVPAAAPAPTEVSAAAAAPIAATFTAPAALAAPVPTSTPSSGAAALLSLEPVLARMPVVFHGSVAIKSVAVAVDMLLLSGDASYVTAHTVPGSCDPTS